MCGRGGYENYSTQLASMHCALQREDCCRARARSRRDGTSLGWSISEKLHSWTSSLADQSCAAGSSTDPLNYSRNMQVLFAPTSLHLPKWRSTLRELKGTFDTPGGGTQAS